MLGKMCLTVILLRRYRPSEYIASHRAWFGATANFRSHRGVPIERQPKTSESRSDAVEPGPVPWHWEPGVLLFVQYASYW
jgi:hypothetical protein